MKRIAVREVAKTERCWQRVSFLTMDIDAVTAWLKNTVPGIVLLGTVGSLLAAALVWFLNRFVLRWLSRGRRVVVQRGFRRGYIEGHATGEIILEKDAVALLSYLVFRLLKIAFFAVMFLGLLIWLVSVVLLFSAVVPKFALAVLSGSMTYALMMFLLESFDIRKLCKWGFERYMVSAQEAFAKRGAQPEEKGEHQNSHDRIADAD